MNEQLLKQLKALQLRDLLEHWDDTLAFARKRNLSHTALLKYVIEQEYRIRVERARRGRIHRAKIRNPYVIETFPWKQQPKLNRKKILSIYDQFSWVENRQNLLWIGPTGTGKTGLATSFLTQAINQGHTGRYILFPELIRVLHQSRADHSDSKVIRKFCQYDVLLIDEIGYLQVDPVQVGLFFTLLHQRHQKKATLITSNLGFSDWTTFLNDDQLTAALIDRLTDNSYVFSMKNCVSIRPKLP